MAPPLKMISSGESGASPDAALSIAGERVRQVMTRVRAAWVSRGLRSAWSTWAEAAVEGAAAPLLFALFLLGLFLVFYGIWVCPRWCLSVHVVSAMHSKGSALVEHYILETVDRIGGV